MYPILPGSRVTLFQTAALIACETHSLEAVMNKHRRFPFFLATLMVMSLAAPGGAWAGGGHHDGKGYGSSYQQKGKSGAHYNNHNKYTYNNYYSNNYYGRSYYKRDRYSKGGASHYPYKYGYNTYCNASKCYSGYCDNDNHNNNNHNSDKLWIGLLGGGIVGYTLSNLYPAP